MYPDVRPAWGKRMHELVKPSTGLLICLEYPLYKDPETGGPPWGVTAELYEQLLAEGFEKVIRYKPERAHPIGMGSDHISVWRRKEN
jgi:hypothetical protein